MIHPEVPLFSLRRPRHVAISLFLVALSAVSLGRAHASVFTITPTFDSSITGDPNATAIEGAINSAIGVLEAQINTPINVNIYFQETSIGLGGSSTGLYSPSYYDYYNLLKAVDTAPGASSAQQTAFASLGSAPTGPSSGNPVNGNDLVYITAPNYRALGFNAPGGVTAANGQNYDTVVSLNTSLTYPPKANNGSNYGLQAVAAHEINEALGIGGTGSNLANGMFGTIGVLDLYRYSAPGVRSFSQVQTTSPYSYFSINGGNTVLSYFNQTSGPDYGDWLSNPIPAGFGPQVQDAFGAPGTDPALGVNELTALNVIGYNLSTASVPEPASVVVWLLLALAMAGPLWRRVQRPLR
jgi:hypothetical protein